MADRPHGAFLHEWLRLAFRTTDRDVIMAVDRAQEKRRLVLSPFLAVFAAVVCLLTAPTLLSGIVTLSVALLLSPAAMLAIDRSERGTPSASAAVGAGGAVFGTAILSAIIPDEGGAVFMFVLTAVLFFIVAGLGISAWRRLRRS